MGKLTYDDASEALISYSEMVDWLVYIYSVCIGDLEESVQTSTTDAEWTTARMAVYKLLPNERDTLSDRLPFLQQCLIAIADTVGIQTNPTVDMLDANRPVVEWDYNGVAISEYIVSPTVLYNLLYNTTYNSFNIELHNNRKYLMTTISEMRDSLEHIKNMSKAVTAFIEYANGLREDGNMSSKGLSLKENIGQQEAIARIQSYVQSVSGLYDALMDIRKRLGVVYSKATSQAQWLDISSSVQSDIIRLDNEINAPLKSLRDPFILLANGAFLNVEESFNRNPNLPIVVDWDYKGVDICQYILTPATIAYILTLLTNGVRNIEKPADEKWIGQVLNEVLPDLFIQWGDMNKAVANFIAEAKYEASRSFKSDYSAKEEYWSALIDAVTDFYLSDAFLKPLQEEWIKNINETHFPDKNGDIPEFTAADQELIDQYKKESVNMNYRDKEALFDDMGMMDIFARRRYWEVYNRITSIWPFVATQSNAYQSAVNVLGAARDIVEGRVTRDDWWNRNRATSKFLEPYIQAKSMKEWKQKYNELFPVV